MLFKFEGKEMHPIVLQSVGGQFTPKW